MSTCVEASYIAASVKLSSKLVAVDDATNGVAGTLYDVTLSVNTPLLVNV